MAEPGRGLTPDEMAKMRLGQPGGRVAVPRPATPAAQIEPEQEMPEANPILTGAMQYAQAQDLAQRLAGPAPRVGGGGQLAKEAAGLRDERDAILDERMGMLEDVAAGQGQQAQAIEQTYRVAGEQAAAVDPALDRVEKERDDRVSRAQSDIDALADRLGSSEPDPDRFWKSKGGAAKAGLLFAQALSGLGAAFSAAAGQTVSNKAQDLISQMIERDIGAQETALKNLEKKIGIKAAGSREIREMLDQKADDLRRKKAAAYEFAARQVDGIGASARGQAIKSEAEQLANKLRESRNLEAQGLVQARQRGLGAAARAHQKEVKELREKLFSDAKSVRDTQQKMPLEIAQKRAEAAAKDPPVIPSGLVATGRVTPENAKAAAAYEEGIVSSAALLDELKRRYDDAGLLGRAAGGRSESGAALETAVQATVGALREQIVGPGAMTEQEYQRIVTGTLGDPTSIAAKNVKARIDTLKTVIASQLRAKQRARGFVPDPGLSESAAVK